MILISYPKYGPFYALEYTNEEKGEIEILREANLFFKTAEVPVEARFVKEYEPDDYINTFIEEENFDLGVLSVKGLHSITEQIKIGSRVKKVIKHVSCDVLVVR